jgi:RNA-dependent RNA polymerase
VMRNALQDYNIVVVDVEGFSVISSGLTFPAPMWAMVDQQNVGITKDYTLPFEVRYQLEVCLSQGVINEYNVTTEFLDALARLAASDQKKATHVLEHVAEKEKRVYDPMDIFKIPEATSYSSKGTKIPHYCAFSRKVTITPTTMYLSSPTVETTNRVIRKYAQAHGDRFLRVQFTDEKFEVIRTSHLWGWG